MSRPQLFLLQWDNFMHQIEPIVSQIPYMTTPGNHERDWPNTGDRFTEVYDSGMTFAGLLAGVHTAAVFVASYIAWLYWG